MAVAISREPGILLALFRLRIDATWTAFDQAMSEGGAPLSAQRESVGLFLLSCVPVAPDGAASRVDFHEAECEWLITIDYPLDPSDQITSVGESWVLADDIVQDLTDPSWYRPYGLHCWWMGSEWEPRPEHAHIEIRFRTHHRQELGG